ncbi:hypothetical protein ANCCEY_00163 [Ancylostoma ceylanicum]|uniref:Ion transport domain-containing protein n=1 Tax=Ancylostoma ceylanicum TaxID=53326 RepID=A0A0D6MDJ2_9BILA|nr:hypothetical protein ANCCEY_00163 [Ancylostoma ceylanicum]
MKNILKDTHEPVIAEQYHKLQERFDDECTALLDQCFYKNEKNTRVCLEINYVSLIHEHQCEMEDTVELMFVASLGKAQISFLLYFFCPILFLRRGPQRLKRREHRVHGENNYGYSSRADTVWYRMYYFYTSPNSKYVIDIPALPRLCYEPMIINVFTKLLLQVFRVFYILFYAFVLVTMTRKTIKVNDLSDFWDEFVISIWQLSYLVEMGMQVNQLIAILVKFLFVFLVFWFTYAVCHISLAGHYKETPNITDITLPWLLFSNGAFEIFGEADDEDKTGDDIMPNASYTTMVPIVLFTYMLVSSIMLVNLVTALLTKKYEDVSRYSHIYWKYKLYDRLVELLLSITGETPQLLCTANGKRAKGTGLPTRAA